MFAHVAASAGLLEVEARFQVSHDGHAHDASIDHRGVEEDEKDGERDEEDRENDLARRPVDDAEQGRKQQRHDCHSEEESQAQAKADEPCEETRRDLPLLEHPVGQSRPLPERELACPADAVALDGDVQNRHAADEQQRDDFLQPFVAVGDFAPGSPDAALYRRVLWPLGRARWLVSLIG